jgi:hypothetical protein
MLNLRCFLFVSRSDTAFARFHSLMLPVVVFVCLQDIFVLRINEHGLSGKAGLSVGDRILQVTCKLVAEKLADFQIENGMWFLISSVFAMADTFFVLV